MISLQNEILPALTMKAAHLNKHTRLFLLSGDWEKSERKNQKDGICKITMVNEILIQTIAEKLEAYIALKEINTFRLTLDPIPNQIKTYTSFS